MVALKSVVGTMNSFLKEEKHDPDFNVSNVKQSVDQEEKDFNEKVDKLLDDGNISTTEEDKMENFPDVHVPHQRLLVHINSNKECLKSRDESVDDLSNVKQSVEQEEQDFNEKVDKLFDDGNISTTEEDQMENFPDVHVPHQRLPVHINSNEECLKSRDKSVDDPINKDALKQFYFTKTLDDYDSCVTKRSSESDIDMDESLIKEPVSVLQRNISEEAEDTSNSDSDLESPSRDSGIESDAMSARKCMKVPDQIERGQILTKNINPQGRYIVKEAERPKNTSLKETGLKEQSKMDECAIIQDFLKKGILYN